MTGSKQPNTPETGAPDKLAKPTSEAGIELSETDLNKASGGAIDSYLKLDGIKSSSSLNFTTPIVPAVQKPGG
jgi:hypothetical protein